jgi:hypothetical protein
VFCTPSFSLTDLFLSLFNSVIPNKCLKNFICVACRLLQYTYMCACVCVHVWTDKAKIWTLHLPQKQWLKMPAQVSVNAVSGIHWRVQ